MSRVRHPRRIRTTYEITGVIQGVGFRPAVHRLAVAEGLAGYVQNRSGMVRLVLEGPPEAVEAFVHRLPRRLPPNASIAAIRCLGRAAIASGTAARSFTVRASDGHDRADVVIPADLAMCPNCRTEIRRLTDRRYGYAFTTCTNCGPRYTVVTAMPYDRQRTTLARFPLCPDCHAEYENPADRRFHAESIACPRCGPSLALEDSAGMRLGGDPIRLARSALAAGQILAVRGIGGYLLASDAFDRQTIGRLRDRKRRPHKPLALMARDLAVLRRYCRVPSSAATLLAAPEAPIVILDAKPTTPGVRPLPLDGITPDGQTLGAMLPYSPLHDLLFRPLRGDPVAPFDLLIMTSGNRGGEPICLSNEEARDRLRGIADVFLVHDREIQLRNDDSLCAVQRGLPQVWRRARGYAPTPVALPAPLSRTVLAMGADMKNAVAVGYGTSVVLSPHVGDLDTPEAAEGQQRVAEALPRFLQRRPDVVAVDVHPDMQATLAGRRLAAQLGVPVAEIQHHHAHGAACLAEHGRDRGLVLAFDGTGMGPDGSIWGAELLALDPGGMRRLATFAPVPLPGGDAAVRQPIRQLVARWADAGAVMTGERLAAAGVDPAAAAAWVLQCERRLNAPLTHAAGRLFDAFASLLGLAPSVATYEGQPAIRLEAAARRFGRPSSLDVPFRSHERDGLLLISWREAFAGLVALDRLRASADAWAMALHEAVARAAIGMVEYGWSVRADRTVALSGGVFMNRILNDLIVPVLRQRGAEVLLHRRVPPNDGGVALGQAVIAGSRTG